jgi:hypothetical protein
MGNESDCFSFRVFNYVQQVQKQQMAIGMLMLRIILLKRVQNAILATYVKIHTLVGTFHREIPV